MHRPRSQIAEELAACICCNECLEVCPALSSPLAIETLNRETLNSPISPEVARFTQACYQCGACVSPCPVGLHRDDLMLWLKMRLLRDDLSVSSDSTWGDRPRMTFHPASASKTHRARLASPLPQDGSSRFHPPDAKTRRRETSW